MNKIEQYLNKIQKVPAKAKIFLLQNLSIMVKAGVPLADGLETLGTQTKNKKLRLIIQDVTAQIKKGENFGEAVAKYENDFGEMFVNIIKAGEASGQLEQALDRLYIQTKKDYKLKSAIIGALIYPLVIIVAMIGIGAFVILFVLPNLTAMFTDMKVELPLPTKILIAISDFVQNNGLLVGISILAGLLTFVKLIRTKKGKYLMDFLFLKTPILSNIVKKINLARMTQNLSSLIQTDIDIVQTLEITSRILGNSLYKKALRESSIKVKSGDKLEKIFKNYPHLFPPAITQMISVGEETGALDEILEKISVFYEEEIEQIMESLPTIIEPILILMVGAGVAGIALAVMLPIFNLTKNF